MDRQMHDGREDGLEPMQSLDIRRPENFAEMLRGMSQTAFGGRSMGEAFDVLRTMVDDPDCAVVLTMSGAMTIAKMGLVLCDMIRTGMAQMLISTGAIMAHGLSEAIGCTHYKHDPSIPDEKLYEWGYNRVYDTLEMEANLSETAEMMSRVLEEHDWSRPTCSSMLNREVGRRLVQEGQMPSVLGCAYEHGVPVYVPAFTDSELGLDVATHVAGQAAHAEGETGPEALFGTAPAFNPFLDLYDYTRRILDAERVGIFTIGGGVPRNWAQQVGPFVDVMNMRSGSDLRVPRFRYGVRICPEPVHWGGLSGCTYSEGVSWGKFVPEEEGGRYAEVLCDATIAWPLLVRAVMEETGRL